MHSPDHIYPTLSYTLFEDMARKFCALMHNGKKAAHSIEKGDFYENVKNLYVHWHFLCHHSKIGRAHV